MNNHDQAEHSRAGSARGGSGFRLPDTPERTADHAAAVFNAMYRQDVTKMLLPLLGGTEDTTLITAGQYVIPYAGADTSQIPYAHLMIALNVNVPLVEASNAYIIEEQGKPPDWVIMLARDSTAESNLGTRRDHFASLGVPEYWLLDDTGKRHGAALIGNRLVNGRYEPIEIEPLPDGSLQGYSAALGILLRWTGEHLDYTGLDSALAETAEAPAEPEQARADAAEARNRELEEELRRLRES